MRSVGAALSGVRECVYVGSHTERRDSPFVFSEAAVVPPRLVALVVDSEDERNRRSQLR